ncbi:hypothetical protein MPL1_08037 [Methylophaga lonarensis MPL]|uniref:Ribosomal subunit interface protein n=1 Tax=Methylophaga lonarensis MPL TaxID=1286106 RepID=M7NVV6_9GAMM|nr:HPF/RaiA family ribosome-associated protein [Methylophaga lonarensis]EMR12903.1 hypothetical protein MPL1_08037 [Methylophaga lonarensis MPL]
MQIQTNTDSHIEGHDALAHHVETTVKEGLRHFASHVTRVEVHLSDENGAKKSDDDKRCLMEARLEGLQPVAVSHNANTIHEAIAGASKKLQAKLSSTLGKLNNR